MSTATEIQIEEHKYIAFAHLIASGEMPLSETTLELIARIHQIESADRLHLAEKHLRHVVGVLLEALDSAQRPEIIKLFRLVYKHEGKG